MSEVLDFQLDEKDGQILLGLSLGGAVIDILTSQKELAECLKLIETKDDVFEDVRIGKFGIYPVTVNLHRDGETSIFIDGPDFDKHRVQSAAVWLERDQLKTVIKSVLKQPVHN
ncbi:MAG TPA: hypothetical protein VL625_09700 [Patescibacteria group bacterium]|jgi:hypothetical protein|nr:hypothetical protein [Patescibacteria group bacterium]